MQHEVFVELALKLNQATEELLCCGCLAPQPDKALAALVQLCVRRT